MSRKDECPLYGMLSPLRNALYGMPSFSVVGVDDTIDCGPGDDYGGLPGTR